MITSRKYSLKHMLRYKDLSSITLVDFMSFIMIIYINNKYYLVIIHIYLYPFY